MSQLTACTASTPRWSGTPQSVEVPSTVSGSAKLAGTAANAGSARLVNGSGVLSSASVLRRSPVVGGRVREIRGEHVGVGRRAVRGGPAVTSGRRRWRRDARPVAIEVVAGVDEPVGGSAGAGARGSPEDDRRRERQSRVAGDRVSDGRRVVRDRLALDDARPEVRQPSARAPGRVARDRRADDPRRRARLVVDGAAVRRRALPISAERSILVVAGPMLKIAPPAKLIAELAENVESRTVSLPATFAIAPPALASLLVNVEFLTVTVLLVFLEDRATAVGVAGVAVVEDQPSIDHVQTCGYLQLPDPGLSPRGSGCRPGFDRESRSRERDVESRASPRGQHVGTARLARSSRRGR